MSWWQVLIVCLMAFVVWDFRRFRRAKAAGQPFAPAWYTGSGSARDTPVDPPAGISESVSMFAYTFDHIAEIIDRFTEVIGLKRFAIYVFDYGAPTGFRIAAKHPERITAIISQNGNAYEEGLSDGWTPIRAYWEDASEKNRDALRAFLKPETTVWQYTHGVPDVTKVSPDGYSLDNFYLSRPGADEVQLDLIGDYKSNVALYPAFQNYFRIHNPPFMRKTEVYRNAAACRGSRICDGADRTEVRRSAPEICSRKHFCSGRCTW